MFTISRLTLAALLSPIALPVAAYKALNNWSLDGDQADERYMY